MRADLPREPAGPVLVTGATGYVAGWLVRRLLEAGLTVHAAVRDPDRAGKVAPLRAMEADRPGRLRLFAADLLEEGSYAAAMEGCRVVFHTASPFASAVEDPQRDLVDPALLGTRNVLEQAGAVPSVERVVLTSSCAAIYGDNADVADAPGGVLTEDVWNTTSSLTHVPYSYSKTLAEREAWRIAGAQERWRLVVVNPSLVIGPAIGPDPTSESFAILRRFGDGTMRLGVPRIGIGVVDVRDVAEAHVAAAFRPDAEGRHIVSGQDTDFFEMAQALRPRFGARYPIPTRVMPKWLVWIAGPAVDATLTRRYVSRNVGLPWRADTAKSRRALGLDYRPMRPALEEMFAQIFEGGGPPP